MCGGAGRVRTKNRFSFLGGLMPLAERPRLCNRWVWFFIEVVKSDFLKVIWFVIGLQFGGLAVIWLGKFNNNDGHLLPERVV